MSTKEETEDAIIVWWCKFARTHSQNPRKTSSYHPLAMAVELGSVSDAAALLEHGRECVLRARTGVGAYCVADFCGYEDRLLEGFDFETRAFTNKCGSMLQVAASRGKMEMLQYLVSRGVSDHCSTAMRVALYNGNEVMVRFLLDAGADVNSSTMSHFLGRSDPLLHAAVASRAATRNTREIVRLLLDRHADVNAVDSRTGATALYEAMYEMPHDVVDLLLDRGADINANAQVNLNAQRFTALIIAVYSQTSPDPERVRKLIRRGADIELAETSTGQTPLMFAVRNGSLSAIRVLLDARANIAARDKQAMTALMHASSSGWHKVVELLVNYPGAEHTVNMADRKGATALCHAAIGFETYGEVEKARSNYGHKVGRPFPHYKEVLDILLANGAEADERFYETLARSEHYRLQSFQKNLL